MAIVAAKLSEILFTNPIVKDDWVQLLINIAIYLMGALAISGLFSLIAKNHSKHYRFYQISFIVNISLSMMIVYSFFYPYLYALLWMTPFIHYTYKIFFYAMAFPGIYLVLKMILPEIRQQKILVVTLILLTSYLVGMTIVQINKKETILKKYQAHLFYPFIDMSKVAGDLNEIETRLIEDSHLLIKENN